MKNWTIKEAVEAINKNDAVAIKEISKHFPMFFLAIARSDLQALAAMMPEKFTVRRLVMTDAAENDADETEAEDTADESGDGDADLSAMSTKELMKLCDKRGIKVPHYGKNKQFYLDALNGGGNDETAEDADDEAGDPYDGKTAMELFKECKKRGIKAEPKKPAKFYAELLRKDDAAANDAGDDEDGWGDGEDEAAEEKAEKKPAKNTKGTKASKATAAKKEKEAAAEDDDDWDI